jgi:hypothetical protein
MRRHEISDRQWNRVTPTLPGKAGDPGRTAQDNRCFVNAVLRVAKTGAPSRRDDRISMLARSESGAPPSATGCPTHPMAIGSWIGTPVAI